MSSEPNTLWWCVRRTYIHRSGIRSMFNLRTVKEFLGVVHWIHCGVVYIPCCIRTVPVKFRWLQSGFDQDSKPEEDSKSRGRMLNLKIKFQSLVHRIFLSGRRIRDCTNVFRWHFCEGGQSGWFLITQMCTAFYSLTTPQIIPPIARRQLINDGSLSFKNWLARLPVHSCCRCFLRISLRLV